MPTAAPPPAQVDPNERSAMVCVRAAGPRPLFFTGKLVAKRPGAAKPPGDFELPVKAGFEQCNHLLRSKIADWSLSVTTPGFTACPLAPVEFGYRVTYSAKAGARGIACPQVARAPIGQWK